MAEVIVMPKLSDTMEEGVIANWVKKEGDSVSEGDILAEIETDKATMEYEAPTSGTILKLVAQPGSKLTLGEPICVIGKKGESFDLSAAGSGKAKAEPKTDEKPAAKAAPAPAAAPTKSPNLSVVSDVSRVSQSSGGARGGRVVASPLAKKIAKEKGIDLGQIQGSGPNGRVVMRDLENLSTRSGSPTLARPAGQDRVVPASMMRQTIAKRLHAAKNDAPHFYLTRSVNMASVMEWRKKLNAAAEKNTDLPKVSVNDIVMMACARALKQHPGCNASWQGESILEYGDVHMAMAVALPTGLITPVIRHCSELNVREIARQSRQLAERAKKGELKPEDYTGGTFTVSNLGMFGIEEFTAIINPPQAAILAVGATIPTPAVDAKGQLCVEQRMKITMSCDHRVIDGAMGAMFLQTLVEYLEDPLAMIS